MIRYDTHALTGTSIDTSTGTIHLLFRRINWSYKYSEVLGFQEHQTCTAMEDSTTATASNKRHSLQDEEDCPVRTSKRQRSRLTEVAAVSTDRQNKNEEASAIYKLSNDELKLCFGCLGQYQYRYIAGTSHRFKQVYDEAVEEKKRTGILSATMSVSRAKLFLEDGPLVHQYKFFHCAANNGNMDIMQWGMDSGYDLNKILNNRQILNNVARNGHLEVVKLMIQVGVHWDESTFLAAVAGGDLDVLKWMKENGCPMNHLACASAAAAGHLDVLKWLREIKCPWDPSTCSAAAENGHLEVLKWARANGCPWNLFSCAIAAKNGHLEVLKWVRANGCPPKLPNTATLKS